MKADFMTTRDETLLVEPDAALTAAVQRDIRHDQVLHHRLQAEAMRALARYERAKGPQPSQSKIKFDESIRFYFEQATTEDYIAQRIEHEIATGAK